MYHSKTLPVSLNLFFPFSSNSSRIAPTIWPYERVNGSIQILHKHRLEGTPNLSLTRTEEGTFTQTHFSNSIKYRGGSSFSLSLSPSLTLPGTLTRTHRPHAERKTRLLSPVGCRHETLIDTLKLKF